MGKTMRKTGERATELVKSFEEGGEVSGDLLTGGREKKTFKVGLLTLGYFEYWRMYPALREKSEKDLAEVTEHLEALCAEISRESVLVKSGMVDTLDSALRAGKLFKREDVDVIVLVGGTYVADFISLAALDAAPAVPLVIFSMQAHENINRQGDYESSLRNSGIIGVAQLTGTLRKLKREFEIIVGSAGDERAYRRIGGRLRAVRAVLGLKEANIGMIGHVFRGMYDIELSKTFLKGAFGVNLIQIQSSHLLEIWEGVTDEEAEEEKRKLLARFKVKNAGEKDVFFAMKLAIAMQRLSEKFHLDALCFLDQHFVQKQVRASARMGASLLMERTGMSVNCEGDIGGLVTMMLMRALSGEPPLMAEWGEYDADSNSCLLIGHGIGTPSLAKSEEGVLLTRTPEEWGFEGTGLNYELVMKPGPATIAHLMEGPEGYRMLVTKAETLDLPRLEFDELHAWAKLSSPVKEYLENIFDFGVSHHCIVGAGDISEELALAAKLLKIKCYRRD